VNLQSEAAEGAIASGMRLIAATVLTPLRFVALAGAIAEGNGVEGLSDLITNLVDGPLWVADPVLYGLRDALPAPFGGPGELVENLRNAIWAATEQINTVVESLLRTPGTPPSGGALINSAVRESSESSISSLPDPQARVLNLSQQDGGQQVDDLKQADPPAEISGGVTSPTDTTPPADPLSKAPSTPVVKAPKLTLNLVRNSLNFSLGAKGGVKRGGPQDGAKVGVDETEEAAQPEVNAPVSEPDADAGAGDTGQPKPGTPGDEE
jgi:hypothetical protein